MHSPRAIIPVCTAAALLAAGLAAQPILVRDSFFISPAYHPAPPADQLWVGRPAVAALGPDTFATAWVVETWPHDYCGCPSDPGDTSVEGRVIDASGGIGPAFFGPSYLSFESSMNCPAIAPTRGGGFIGASIDWSDWGTELLAQRFGAGSRALEEPVVVHYPGEDGGEGLDGCPAVAAHPGGRYVLAWLEELRAQDESQLTTTLRFQVFLPSGEPVGPSVSLGDQMPIQYFWSLPDPPALGMDGTGGFSLVWWAADGSLRGKRFGMRGAPLGKPFPVAESAAGGPALAMARDGGFVVAWTGTAPKGTPQPLLLRRFTAAGTPAGPAVEIDRGVSGTPLLAADHQGNFALAWQGKLQLFNRLLVPQGEKISAPADRLALSDAGHLLTVTVDGLRVRGRLWRARFGAPGPEPGGFNVP